MKKWHLAVVVALCIGLATGVYAFGPGHGRMEGGGCAGQGPGYGAGGGPGFGAMANLDLSKEQADQLWQMREKHRNDTQPLRREMFQRRFELRKLFADPKVDGAAILAKQKELSVVQQKLSDQRAQLRVEERKILAPDQIKKLNEAPAGRRYGHGRFGGKGFGAGAGCGQRASCGCC